MGEYQLPLDKLIPALINFQAECPAIVKDKENTFITEKNKGKKAMYADLASINETIKKTLSANGLAVTQPIRGGVLETYLYHSSGQFIKSEFALSTEGKASQAVGSEITYMRRYCLCAVLGIAADDDDDGNGASGAPLRSNTTTMQNKPALDKAKSPCSESQRRKIESLWQELGKSEAALKMAIKKSFGVDLMTDLETTQAISVIKDLEKQVADAKA